MFESRNAATENIPPAHVECWWLAPTAGGNAWKARSACNAEHGRQPGACNGQSGPYTAPTMLLAPSSPTSQGEQESTQESAAEPCCVNEAREGDEGIGEYVYWGYDLKPAMPPAPGVSVVLGAICSAIVQIPLLCRLQSWPRPRFL